MESNLLHPQSIQIARKGSGSGGNFEEVNTMVGNEQSFNISNGSEGRNSGDVVKDLGARLLKLNRKILEPVLKDLEVANLVFSSVNVSTKKALKEFVFLKQKEKIEREKIRNLIEERNSQLLQEKKNSKRITILPSVTLKQEQIAVKTEPPKQVESTREATQQQPSKKPTSQKKVPSTIPSTKRVATSSKGTNEKAISEPIIPEKVSTQKKKLEDILSMARKIRSREEEAKVVKSVNSTAVNIEPPKLVLDVEPEPEDPAEENTQEEEPKLSFVTVDERFQHYVSILKSFNETKEKSEELTLKLSKKSGWALLTPKLLNGKKTMIAPQTSSMKNKYNSLIAECLKENKSYNDVQDFKNRFWCSEDEMQKLEEELLLNTKEKKKPELTPTNIIYSDIPNSYICRWLPKRVNKQTTQTVVPYKDLSKKFDNRRAKFPCKLFNFNNKDELRNIYLKRFEVQQLMLKNYLYQNIFKGDVNLLNYLPQLKEEGQEEVYFKLLRCLEGIIPCEALRNENHRNIINWKSMYHFLPSSNNETDENLLDEDDHEINNVHINTTCSPEEFEQ